ncbi:putative F-box/FBD/LRR-repeat protein At1g78760 isoform X1 [Papaver somniferum]|uniref:putative F-box/FBD/LRR-repeat protein At1g78760 isoform X1 n=1 Tax=Papaver somniferum TaxID=3469 RepID=UPI000E6F5DB3|nr:putative F-box/FBD/LRR-repeat protein At1g78760 isoform X1 [Papaver somniferum]
MEEETTDSPESSSPESKEDRFSLLPNALIHHILSFVDDMRITVQMSILSNRWRHIWRSLPALTFKNNLIETNGFRHFVTTALMLHDDIDIRTLSVLWIDPLNTDIDISDVFNTWVLYAVKRKVKELLFSVIVYKPQVFEFPECVYNCKSLTYLHLYLGSMYHSTLRLPESIHLPNLKYVKFEALHLNEVLMNEFFTSCPALESVTIKDCIMGDLEISSHTLKYFTLAYSSFNGIVSNVASPVLLFAPNLEVFDIICHPSQLCLVIRSKSLVKADVEIIVQEKRNNPYTYSELPGEPKDMYAKAMMLMLEKFHNVKDLTLSSRFIQIISRSPNLSKTQPPQLANLRCLRLHTFLSKGCAQAIFYLPRISPKIESLSVRIDKDCFAEQPTELYCDEINFFPENIEDYWKPGLTSPCEPLHLKVVELVDVYGSVNELRFVEVFLNMLSNWRKWLFIGIGMGQPILWKEL